MVVALLDAVTAPLSRVLEYDGVVALLGVVVVSLVLLVGVSLAVVSRVLYVVADGVASLARVRAEYPVEAVLV